MNRSLAALGTVVLALALAPSALTTPCPRTSLADVENEVMCLVCGVHSGPGRRAPG
jgi:hypothetical protein